MDRSATNHSNQIRLVGPFAATSGYAKMNRGVLRALQVAGFEVQAIESDLRQRDTGWGNSGIAQSVEIDGRVFPQSAAGVRRVREVFNPRPQVPMPDCQWEDLERAKRTLIAHDAPTLYVLNMHNLGIYPQYGDTPTIGWCMTESDNLCPEWIQGARNVDMLLAPSTFVGRTFERVVPEVISTVCPLPVDDRLWNLDEYVEDIGAERPPFLFLTVFQSSERKQWRQMMLAFAEEFQEEREEVGLLVKAIGPADVEQLAGWCRDLGAWVYVDREIRTDWTLAAIYRACQCYLQCSSEGFGLPYVEAALCGIPSVALNKGGAADVVTEEVGYLVPSLLKPIPGHMPQVYPRDSHRFAVASIGDIRKTLRRAYEEEKAGAAKGVKARARALERFTPAAIAPLLREVVDTANSIHRASYWLEEYPVKPEWATTAGNWGDVFCAVGSIKAMLADKELPQIGVIYYGRDGKIVEWLRLQPWCRDVIGVLQNNKKVMTQTFMRLCHTRPAHSQAAWYEVLENAGFDMRGKIAFTQLNLAEEKEPVHWRGAILPEEAHQWARDVAQTVDGEFLLLQPRSLASNPWRNHWPYWKDAIEWALDNTSIPLVLVGENVIDIDAHPMLVNVSGQSCSMMDVLALSERAAGALSTSNNLGIYAPISGLKCVLANTLTCHKLTFYHRWQRTDNITMIEFDDPLSDFKIACWQRFPDYFRMPAGTTETIERDVLTEAEYYAAKE